jgi:hypothetical protein
MTPLSDPDWFDLHPGAGLRTRPPFERELPLPTHHHDREPFVMVVAHRDESGAAVRITRQLNWKSPDRGRRHRRMQADRQ